MLSTTFTSGEAAHHEFLLRSFEGEFPFKKGAGDETRTRDIFLGKENSMSVEPLKY
jgi:hypothetical protein